MVLVAVALLSPVIYGTIGTFASCQCQCALSMMNRLALQISTLTLSATYLTFSMHKPRFSTPGDSR